jgi:glycosyltransferase involved in cell wall biosynthesis
MVTSIHPDFDTRIMKQLNSLADFGYQIDLICPWEGRSSDISGVDFLTFKRARKRLTRFMNYLRIGKYLLKKRYALYHIHDIDILPLFCVVKFLSKKPVIYDNHENYPEEMLVRFWVPEHLRWVLYFIVKYVQRICASYIGNLILVVPSQEAEFGSQKYNKVMVRNYASKILLETRAANYEARQDAVIFTGVQSINNGSILFLEIANGVLKKYPNVKFLCIDWFDGDNALRKQMDEYIKKFAIQENISFLSPVKGSEIMSYLNMAKIGISPNLRVDKQIKALPTKLFEYMAAGLPIVTSNLPHQTEIIKKSNCGLLADPDFPDDFVDKICFLISNQSKAKEMGENGKNAFLEHYCWETDVLKLKELYELLLRKTDR